MFEDTYNNTVIMVGALNLLVGNQLVLSMKNNTIIN